jgi:hypothetical protein
MTMESWTQPAKQNGASMNADKASGVFRVSLECLALHYGKIDIGRVAAIRQDGAYGRGLKDLLEFAGVFAVTAQGAEKNVIGKFIAAAQKRFGGFAWESWHNRRLCEALKVSSLESGDIESLRLRIPAEADHRSCTPRSLIGFAQESAISNGNDFSRQLCRYRGRKKTILEEDADLSHVTGIVSNGHVFTHGRRQDQG